MLDTHHNGVGICAVCERLDDAEAKVNEARELARQHGFPLELTYAHGNPNRTRRPIRLLEEELGEIRAKWAQVDKTHIRVELIDGRTLSVPLTWFPKLMSASADQRECWTLDDAGGPLSWSEIGVHMSVGGLLVGREGQSAVRPARRPKSIEGYRAALDECSRERAPLEWAKAQCDLGSALLAYNIAAPPPSEDDVRARLSEAIRAYRAALEEYCRADMPHQWAMTAGHLADALFGLGAYEPGTARIEEAITIYQAILSDRVRMSPQRQASIQHHLASSAACSQRTPVVRP